MDKTKLNEELATIHQELGQVLTTHQTLDGPMIESLRMVAADIDRVLADQRSLSNSHSLPQTPPAPQASAVAPASAAGPASSSETLPQTLEALAEQFSVDHPQTAALLSRMGYLLSNLGI